MGMSRTGQVRVKSQSHLVDPRAESPVGFRSDADLYLSVVCIKLANTNCQLQPGPADPGSLYTSTTPPIVSLVGIEHRP
ncbi:hypothetical protein XENTR_v10004733 [Xenopus tropicalis]|nr:hypothetical protein XENTR_v10004733 [Xenopus tropicalis]